MDNWEILKNGFMLLRKENKIIIVNPYYSETVKEIILVTNKHVYSRLSELSILEKSIGEIIIWIEQPSFVCCVDDNSVKNFLKYVKKSKYYKQILINLLTASEEVKKDA